MRHGHRREYYTAMKRNGRFQETDVCESRDGPTDTSLIEVKEPGTKEQMLKIPFLWGTQSRQTQRDTKWEQHWPRVWVRSGFGEAYKYGFPLKERKTC